MKTRFALAMTTVIAGISGGLAFPTLATAETELSPTAEQTFTEIRSCLSQEDSSLNALFLLDASSSLPENTDPDNLRSRILAQALDQLGSVAENRDVNWAVVKFDLGAEVMKPWEPLAPGNVEEATVWAQSQDDWWGRGQGTDWLSGLKEADAYMRSAPPSPISCNMTIWLTDGGINVDGGWNKEVNAEAINEICGRSPVSGNASETPSVVNSIRSSNTHLIGVVLKSEEYLASTDEKTRNREESSLDFMRPITEGSGEVRNSAFVDAEPRTFEFSCGDNGPGLATGALLSGSSPIALAYNFADLANGIVGGEAIDLGADFPVSFPIEPGINVFSVQLAGSQWQLSSPDGTVVAERDQESATNVRVSQRGDLASIQVTGEQVADGSWTLNVEEPLAGARLYTDVRLTGRFSLPTLQVGEATEVGVEFIDAFSQSNVRGDSFEATDVVMRITQGGQQAQDLSCVRDDTSLEFTCPYTPSEVGSALLQGSLEVTTRDGTVYDAWSGQSPSTVRPPANFPSVSPEAVSLSPLDGRRGSAQGQITLVGPERGSGQVCLPEASEIVVVSDVIDRSSAYDYSQAPWGECIDVGEGQRTAVDIAVRNSTAASGFVELSVPLRLLSDESTNEEQQNVAIEFETIRQGTPPIWLVALLILVGLGFPIALLYAQARSAARLSLSGLQQAVIPIEISVEATGVSVRRQRGGELINLDDWSYLPSGQARPRSFTPTEGAQIVAVTPRNPVGPIRAQVRAVRGYRVVTSEGGTTDGLTGNFGLMPAGQWFMSAKESDLRANETTFPGMLVAFANPSGGALPESGREIGIAAQDNSIIGAWEALKSRAGVDRTSESSGETTSGSSHDLDENKSDPDNPFDRDTSNSPESTPGASPASPTNDPQPELSPFDELLDENPGGRGSSTNSPNKNNTTNPFEDL